MHLEPVSFTYSFYRFNVHRSRRVLPDERQDLQRLAQYIIRNPFAVEKMQVSAPAGPILTDRSYLPLQPQTSPLRAVQGSPGPHGGDFVVRLDPSRPLQLLSSP